MTVAQAGPRSDRQTDPPPGQVSEGAVLAALTLLALTPNLPGRQLAAAAEALLAPLGVAAEAARAAAMLAFGAPLLSAEIPADVRPGPALAFTARTSPARRAAYLLNAARRIDGAYGRVVPQMRAAESLAGVGDEADAQKLRERAARDARFEERERQFLAQHLAAERARAEAAERVDAAAQSFGSVLGWRSRRDDLVTPECREADGKSFRAERPPAIGFPGTLHGGACRCIPVAPTAGADFLP